MWSRSKRPEHNPRAKERKCYENSERYREMLFFFHSVQRWECTKNLHWHWVFFYFFCASFSALWCWRYAAVATMDSPSISICCDWINCRRGRNGEEAGAAEAATSNHAPTTGKNKNTITITTAAATQTRTALKIYNWNSYTPFNRPFDSDSECMYEC